MVPPHLHHQVSMEFVMDPLATPRLSSDDKTQAQSIFQDIVQHCENYEQWNRITSTRKYKRGTLLQLIYNYSISDLGRESILRYFLSAMIAEKNFPNNQNFSHVLSTLSNFNARNTSQKDEIAQRAQELADHLVDGFFLPLRASSARTPQPTPHLTPPPGQCLVRDRYRCVISRLFDEKEARRRFNSHHESAIDDDGKALANEDTAHLEVAHILPHALTSSNDGQPILNEKKMYTLRVLDMFDPGIIHSIEGANIDRPYNAVTLTSDFHQRFGELEIYFEAIPGVDHTYTIKSVQSQLGSQPRLPITRTLFTTPGRTIEPPMPRLLAIHRAFCLILNISGAAEYINKVLQDEEEGAVMSDGSTELATLVSLGLYRSKTTTY